MTKRIFSPWLLFLIALAACKPAVELPAENIISQPDTAPDTLTICLGDEPKSIYLYNDRGKSADLVRQAIYDGPVDVINGQPVPVILESLPSFETGGAVVESIAVGLGDRVVDAKGRVTLLDIGVEVFPSGCLDQTCATAFDGETPLEMDQISAEFTIKPGILWSDGQAVTAQDSVFSFEIASDPATPASHYFTDRTASYIPVDDLTVEWRSLPGLRTDEFTDFFWTPLPVHQLGQYQAEELLSAEEANRQPLGWGPYVIQSWLPGKSIELTRNPFYFRAEYGLPRFDRLVFRITDANGDTNLANLKYDREPFSHLDYDIGEFENEIAENGCDLTTTTADMRDQMGVFNYLLNYYQDPAIRLFRSAESETQFLLFNSGKGNQEKPQDSTVVRQAVSQCIDRDKLIQSLSNNVYETPTHTDIGLPEILETPADFLNYDLIQAAQILEETGWMDHDGNSETPRISKSVEGFLDGRELGFTLLAAADNESQNTASMLKSMLSSCGIGLNITFQPEEALWNPDADLSYFSDDYDLALIAWQTPIQAPCLFFDSAEIPTDSKLGANFSRFSDQRLDEICSLFDFPIRGTEQEILMSEIQAIIHEKLPLVPLYNYSSLLTARNDFCGDGLNPERENELSELEEFRISSACR